MAVTYGFYDSLSNDRRYNALQFSSLIDSLIIDGVFANILGGLFVEDGVGLHVIVNGGRAWFDHTWTYNDAQLTLDITTPHVTLDRIDTVVLETNSDSATRANSIKIVDGTPASSPVAPTLTHTATIHQHPLADIYVTHSATEINQENITNRIGTSDCPFVTGILQTIDIDFLFAQWGDDFTTWFTFLQDELDANQAANLQAQILEHDHTHELYTQIPEDGILDGAVSLLKLAATLRFQKLFEFIADGNSDFDWSSIPQTFTHLLLIYNGASSYTGSGNDLISVLVNNDSSAAYYTQEVWNAKSPYHDEWSTITNPHAHGLWLGGLQFQSLSNYMSSTGFIIFPNYKGTTFYKTALSLNFIYGPMGPSVGLTYSYRNNVEAINRLTSMMVMMPTYHPRAGSVFSLYGFN